MKHQHEQRGISLIGLLVVIIIVGILGLAVIRLFPVYYDYFVVTSVLSDVKAEVSSTAPSAIRDTLRRRFNINEVHVIDVEDVKIKPVDRGSTKVLVHYEDRVPFIANLSLVATFDASVKVSRR